MLIVFDDMIAYMEATKELSPIVTELFLKGRKLNNLPVFYHNFISKHSTNCKKNTQQKGTSTNSIK